MKAEVIATVVVKAMKSAFAPRDAEFAALKQRVSEIEFDHGQELKRLESAVLDLQANEAARRPVRE